MYLLKIRLSGCANWMSQLLTKLPQDLQKQKIPDFHRGFLEAPPRFELGVRVLQTHALPLGYSAEIGADYEARTRYLHLGKVALYQMS